MIYQVMKTESKNEFIVNSIVQIKVVHDRNKKMKTEVNYENNILTKNEAKQLSNEFLTYFNRMHQ